MSKNDYIFLSGLALWLIETWAFGWNRVSQSTPELVLDRISMLLMGYGALLTVVEGFRPRVNVNVFSNEEQYHRVNKMSE